jgi:hypothetical protein
VEGQKFSPLPISSVGRALGSTHWNFKSGYPKGLAPWPDVSQATRAFGQSCFCLHLEGGLVAGWGCRQDGVEAIEKRVHVENQD